MELYDQQRTICHQLFTTLIAHKICFYLHPAKREILKFFSHHLRPDDFSDLFLRLKSEDFIYNGNEWYHFEGHRWHFIDKITNLKDMLYELFYNWIDQFSEEFSIYKTDIYLQDYFMLQIINRVTNQIYQNQIYQPRILDKLDNNKFLLHFENGVFDLKRGIFRDGRRDDYITLSTGIKYRPMGLYSNPQAIKEIDLYMTQLFPVFHEREKVLDNLSYILSGNIDQICQYWEGKITCSGTLLKIIENIMGEYYYSLGYDGIKYNESYKIQGKRVIILLDIDNKKINPGLISELVSGDRILVRRQITTIEFRPQATVIIPNSNPPNWGNRRDVWRKTRIIPFRTNFEADYHQVFTQDDNYETWMSLLINRYMANTHNQKYKNIIFPQFPLLIRKIIASYY